MSTSEISIRATVTTVRNSAWCETFSSRMRCAASEVRSLIPGCARAKALIRAGLAEMPGEVLVLTPDGELVKRYFDGRSAFGPKWNLESVGCPSCEGAHRRDCSTCGGRGFIDATAQAPAGTSAARLPPAVVGSGNEPGPPARGPALLRAWLEVTGISVPVLAHALGLHASGLSRWLGNRGAVPTLATAVLLERIADAHAEQLERLGLGPIPRVPASSWVAICEAEVNEALARLATRGRKAK